MVVGGGGVPSDYFVSTQLQLWLFCFWGCGCCWAVTINNLYLRCRINAPNPKDLNSTTTPKHRTTADLISFSQDIIELSSIFEVGNI